MKTIDFFLKSEGQPDNLSKNERMKATNEIKILLKSIGSSTSMKNSYSISDILDFISKNDSIDYLLEAQFDEDENVRKGAIFILEILRQKNLEWERVSRPRFQHDN